MRTAFGDAAATNNLLRPDGGNTSKLKHLIHDSVHQTSLPYEDEYKMRKRDLDWSRRAAYELSLSMKSSKAEVSTMSSGSSARYGEVDLDSSAVSAASNAFRDVNMKVRAKRAESKRDYIGSNIASKSGGRVSRRKRNAKKRGTFAATSSEMRAGGSDTMRFEALLDNIYGSSRHK